MKPDSRIEKAGLNSLSTLAGEYRFKNRKASQDRGCQLLNEECQTMGIIKKAIFPVAGNGTRLLPATKVLPKEILPVLDKPAIQYIVEDAVTAEIEQIIFITSRGKNSLEDHFDRSFELETNLKERQKNDLLKKVISVSKLAKFSYVRQPMQLGDGHAIMCARHLVGEEPVLIVFGDTLYDAPIPISKQVMDAYENFKAPIIGLAEVSEQDVNKYGIIKGLDLGAGNVKITGFVEKPDLGKAPSNLAAVGIYVITSEVFECLDQVKKQITDELKLANVFKYMVEKGYEIYGRKLKGEWLDIGNKLNYTKAFIKFGLKDEEISADVKKFIQDLYH